MGRSLHNYSHARPCRTNILAVGCSQGVARHPRDTVFEKDRAAELFDLGRPDEALAIHHAAEGETKVM